MYVSHHDSLLEANPSNISQLNSMLVHAQTIDSSDSDVLDTSKSLELAQGLSNFLKKVDMR
jgi:hypothetical protein